ncbi:hypothetical protein, partial [Psychromonas sp. MB-3u-54]|uniref:hypothetical protein n=1 Tax=Psychromonas sp. MB-3u-54 TaxID=2058319 RepID=UPI001E4C0631
SYFALLNNPFHESITIKYQLKREIPTTNKNAFYFYMMSIMDLSSAALLTIEYDKPYNTNG